MTRATIGFSLLLWVLITAITWPVFVLASSLISYWVGEGAFVDSYNLIPNDALFADFIAGYRGSLIVTVPLGLLAVLDFHLLSRHRLTWIIAGFSLPAACIAIAFYFYRDPMPLLPAFSACGVFLFIVYRTTEWLRRVY